MQARVTVTPGSPIGLPRNESVVHALLPSAVVANTISVWGKDKEWDAEITEQVPDGISRGGATTSDARNAGEDDFKEFIEGRGRETGAWRGEVHGGETDSRH